MGLEKKIDKIRRCVHETIPKETSRAELQQNDTESSNHQPVIDGNEQHVSKERLPTNSKNQSRGSWKTIGKIIT